MKKLLFVFWAKHFYAIVDAKFLFIYDFSPSLKLNIVCIDTFPLQCWTKKMILKYFLQFGEFLCILEWIYSLILPLAISFINRKNISLTMHNTIEIPNFNHFKYNELKYFKKREEKY